VSDARLKPPVAGDNIDRGSIDAPERNLRSVLVQQLVLASERIGI
jgi:hypothetical protein